MKRERLTEQRVARLKAPESGETFLWDTDTPGFGIRCYAPSVRHPKGRRVWVLQYRAGHGRGARQRRLVIGDVARLSLDEARTLARKRFGEIADGRDPQAEQRETKRREDARLDKALDAYDAYLGRRGAVNRKYIVSTLKSGLLTPLGKIDLDEVDRQAIVQQIDQREEAGKPGAAQDLRAKAATFLNWAVNRGLIHANPLAGYRRERMTRQQATGRRGKRLDETALKAIWTACEGVSRPYGDFVRLLMLTGQRRLETSRMRWRDVDTAGG
ncbi:MAG: integrase family protein, partial [Parvibaculum sp.]